MATPAQKRTLREAENALIRAMSDEQLAAIIGDTPEQSAEFSRRVAHLSIEEIDAVLDGDPEAEHKFLTAIYGSDESQWPK